MTLIAKAAYFVMCEQCPVTHGTIICTDGSRMLCYSKTSARECAAELIKQKLVTADEKPGLLEQIDASPLREHSREPALFAPSQAYDDAHPDPEDGAEIDCGESAGADDEHPTLH